MNNNSFLDMDIYERFSKKDGGEYECCWCIDDIHDKVTVQLMFGQLEFPICNRHLQWHKNMLALGKVMDMHEVMKFTYDECAAEVSNRGLIPTEQ